MSYFYAISSPFNKKNVDKFLKCYLYRTFNLIGGGSGFGVITKMQTAIVQSPEPPEGGDRNFCNVRVQYATEDDAVRKDFLSAFQDFLYGSNPDRIKFGGGGNLAEHASYLQGLFLGSKEEFVKVFTMAGLLKDEHLDNSTSSYSEDYKSIPTPEGVPEFGVHVDEFSSYGEASLYRTCNFVATTPILSMEWTASSSEC